MTTLVLWIITTYMRERKRRRGGAAVLRDQDIPHQVYLSLSRSSTISYYLDRFYLYLATSRLFHTSRNQHSTPLHSVHAYNSTLIIVSLIHAIEISHTRITGHWPPYLMSLQIRWLGMLAERRMKSGEEWRMEKKVERRNRISELLFEQCICYSTETPLTVPISLSNSSWSSDQAWLKCSVWSIGKWNNQFQHSSHRYI